MLLATQESGAVGRRHSVVFRPRNANITFQFLWYRTDLGNTTTCCTVSARNEFDFQPSSLILNRKRVIRNDSWLQPAEETGMQRPDMQKCGCCGRVAALSAPDASSILLGYWTDRKSVV